MLLEKKPADSISERASARKKESVGVREALNQSRYVVAGLAAAAILVAGYFIVSTLREGGAPGYASYSFYSDDDGASYFTDSNKLVSPFDHHGKLAYRAHVYTCDNGKTKWVGYMDGYLPDARKKIVDLQAAIEELGKNPNAEPPPKDKDPMYVLPAITRTGLVLKQPDKPGRPPNKWVCQADGAAYASTQKIVCPNGGTDEPREIFP